MQPANIETKSRLTRTLVASVHWLATSLVAYEMTAGALWDLAEVEFVRTVMAHLGYPQYVLFIIGIFKLPCAIALVVPGLARVREWAYAGAFFNYFGAWASHALAGDGIAQWLAPAIFMALTFVSWGTLPRHRRLGTPAVHRPTAPEAPGWRRTAYWVFTSMVCAEMLLGASWALFSVDRVESMLIDLGYPLYLASIIGTFQCLGALALWIDRYPRPASGSSSRRAKPWSPICWRPWSSGSRCCRGAPASSTMLGPCG